MHHKCVCQKELSTAPNSHKVTQKKHGLKAVKSCNVIFIHWRKTTMYNNSQITYRICHCGSSHHRFMLLHAVWLDILIHFQSTHVTFYACHWLWMIQQMEGVVSRPPRMSCSHQRHMQAERVWAFFLSDELHGNNDPRPPSSFSSPAKLCWLIIISLFSEDSIYLASFRCLHLLGLNSLWY